MDDNSYAARGRLVGSQRHKLRKLLNMKYRPSELAEEVGFNVRQIYNVYLPMGCPHERDTRRHVWIVGSEFREWYQEVYKKRKLTKNQAYCVSCKKAVAIINPVENSKDGLTYILCECPVCKNTVAKITAMQKRG